MTVKVSKGANAGVPVLVVDAGIEAGVVNKPAYASGKE